MRTCPFRYLLFLVTLVSGPAFAADSPHYAVSYLWHRDLASVRAYRDKVARVLGPAMAKRLEVVSDGGLFGLIYDRNGDSAGATRVARAHAHLLRREGLESSVPVRSRHWVVVGDEVTPPVVSERPKETDLGDADPAQPASGGAASSPAKPEPLQTLANGDTDLTQPASQTAGAPPVHPEPLPTVDKGSTDSTRPATESTAPLPANPEPEPVQTADGGGADPTQQATERTGRSPSEPEPARASAPRTSDIEQAVEDYIKGLRRQGRIDADERTGWSVYDFTTGKKLVTINEDEQFQAASLIKPFIAAAFFHRVEQGELIYGPRSRRHMRAMIQRSSNAAADWVMRRVGGPRTVQRILQGHYGSIFRQTSVVEYIPLNGRTYRNKASVHDYSRFLYAVWKGGISGSREIKRLMALPGPDRIFRGVEEIPHVRRIAIAI